MGARFELEHANLVAYLTAEKAGRAPRIEIDRLYGFLNSFADGQLIRSNTISKNAGWQTDLQRQSRRALQHIRTQTELGIDVLSESEVARALAPLRSYFTGYELYVLLVPPSRDFRYEGHEEILGRTYREFVERSKISILVLWPHTGSSFLNVIDPFPALQSLAASAVPPPAVVLWTRKNNAVALSVPEARLFFDQYIASEQITPTKLDAVISRESKRRVAKKILHISDLHFGNPIANQRRNYLKQHLANVVKGVDQIVISGDLFDDPNNPPRADFEEFRTDLRDMTNKEPIIVVGNHDVRRMGNALGRFGRKSELVTDIGFRTIVTDSELRAIFVCFNSCDGGNYAAGRVSTEQRRSRAAELEQVVRRSPETAEYTRIAVVHHHPYNYSTAPTTTYEKLLERLLPNADRFTSFENAREFMNWCAARGISLILHGHKHVPHIVEAKLNVRDLDRDITIVGCGSTTGVENTPMCYDLISVDPITGRFGVHFFHDPDGDGSGFSLQSLSIDLRDRLPS